MSNETNFFHKKRFTTVDNTVINDPNLSWGAKGILLYLLSRPAGWKFYVEEIGKHANCTVGQVRRYLAELENNDYLCRYSRGVKGSNRLVWIWYADDSVNHVECIKKVREMKPLPDEIDGVIKDVFATMAKCHYSKTPVYNNTDIIVNTDLTERNIPPIGDKPLSTPQGVSRGANRKAVPKFAPPSLQEWLDYARECKLRRDRLESAWRGYEAAGWHDSRGQPIRNWKLKMRMVWDKEENRDPDADIPDKPISAEEALERAKRLGLC